MPTDHTANLANRCTVAGVKRKGGAHPLGLLHKQARRRRFCNLGQCIAIGHGQARQVIDPFLAQAESFLRCYQQRYLRRGGQQRSKPFGTVEQLLEVIQNQQQITPTQRIEHGLLGIVMAARVDAKRFGNRRWQKRRRIDGGQRNYARTIAKQRHNPFGAGQCQRRFAHPTNTGDCDHAACAVRDQTSNGIEIVLATDQGNRSVQIRCRSAAR